MGADKVASVAAAERVMDVSDCATQVRGVVELLRDVNALRHRLGTRELVGLTREVLALLQIAETATVSLVADALQRGLVAESTAAGPAQWFRD